MLKRVKLYYYLSGLAWVGAVSYTHLITTEQVLQAVDVAVEMQKNGDLGLDVPNYVDDVSNKVVKIIQSYTGVVNKMVWRKY